MKLYLQLLLIFFPALLFSQDIRSLNYSELSEEIVADKENIQIVNFWATWCKPCIEELPYFEKVGTDYSNKGVKVKMVNLDFNSKLESVTVPFVKKHKLKSDVYHITDTDPNEWINKVEPRWSGAIPATVIYYRGEKKFFKEGELNQQQLVFEVEKILEENRKSIYNNQNKTK